MVGRVGADAFGEQLLAQFKVEGIDTRFVGVDPNAATGVALITVDLQGQNSISVASGANFTLTAQEVCDAWEQLQDTDVLVMPLETPMETIVTAAGLARQHGIKVVLNPAPAQHLSPDLLRLVDVLIPNEIETTYMTGIEIGSLQNARLAAEKLMASGPGSVILTLGHQGALLVEGQPGVLSFTHLEAYPVQAVDTTAAGDAFVGAIAVALGEGRSLVEAARFASAAAALSVTRQGAQPSLPTRAEVVEFIRTRTAA
jgi:ribokinase